MNRRAVRLVVALLALIVGAAVSAVTAVGLVGLVADLVLIEPMSQGRIVSASLVTTGAALLVSWCICSTGTPSGAPRTSEGHGGGLGGHGGIRWASVSVTRGPVLLADLVPATVAEIGRRAARDDFDRWAAQAQGCGHCSRPIRLEGSSTTRTADGRLVDGYDTRTEPDGVTYVRCGNRRAAVCPSCSHEYQGDMWHLLYAGTAGGIKNVPESVATHPLDFVTLTAPSFGAVHTTRGSGKPCHPRGRRPRFCPHGRPEHCPRVHRDDDPDLGAPLCPDCYDYAGQVAFNWYAPELWRRFTITLGRRLADLLGIPRTRLRDHLAVSLAKVAEFQRRGVVHFHALVRLDGPGADYPPPAISVTVEQLRNAIHAAARDASVVTDPYEWRGPTWELRFGRQLHVRPVHGQAQRDASTGPMHPQMVAAYIAKYATKAAEDFGLAPQRIHTH